VEFPRTTNAKKLNFIFSTLVVSHRKLQKGLEVTINNKHKGHLSVCELIAHLSGVRTDYPQITWNARGAKKREH